MAQESQFAAALLHETVQTFNGNVSTVSPQDGISLIDNWIHALRSGDASTNPIASTLSALKMQLQSGNPNPGQILAFLEQLADQTQQAADKTDGLQQSDLHYLSLSLREFSHQLDGKRSSAGQIRN